MAIVPAFLRASGAFFLKRNLKEEIAPLYKVNLKKKNILYSKISKLNFFLSENFFYFEKKKNFFLKKGI
jgi:isopenicillin N synthase-like dioxygenase